MTIMTARTNPRPAPPRRQRGGNERLQRHTAVSLREATRQGDRIKGEDWPRDAAIDCGWGRLIFAHTFTDGDRLVELLREEPAGRRDIAFYVHEPHVLLAKAPQALFLDPSHTYRLQMSAYRPARRRPKGFAVRRLRTIADAQAVNDIYAGRGMVQVDPAFFWTNRMKKHLTFLVAEDLATGKVLAAVTGIDHVNAFRDPENGSSLWSLAVDPQAPYPGIGEAMVRHLAEHFAARGRAYMDLSVMHDNDQAIGLYEKLGFQRVPVFAVKTKNTINEKLFAGPPVEENLNPYAMLLVNEARRRGIGVEVLDAEGGFFKLTHGGRSITCRESLSELTTAVAMSRCDDKAVTRRLMEKEGLRVPAQRTAGDTKADIAFLKEYKSVVVKPARGEQGRGISVDVRGVEELKTAIETARRTCDTVLIEELVQGEDLRLIVIGFKLVAAAVRRPPSITGTGHHTVEQLIEKLSRRRAAATGGESRIPMDVETERCVAMGGYELDSILPENETLLVRKTANLHTGGTIHDVTDQLHPALVDAAVKAARAIDIPVVGLDFIVPSAARPDYAIIEANERPGLANHEPQPTAERFIDLLFPQTAIDRWPPKDMR
ncbi:GNAT-family acetyltransferase (TIGR03103 family) [Oceanibaculum indicum]|uniref:N-acetyltransferase GCN5 n=3 Tax=Oceanibaculum indicum TaxID=526216 RepID=K2KMV7_9PROT|nr:N-acetyltransferase GCN5 [Oceanibaculum indicum P24]RKQ72449.1 GNAT-family acetyltransferase (TIGR03103 family) [Oceanibaculum indicum]